MATIKSYTDIEQSKKLAEILPLESADMHYCLEQRDVASGYEIGITPYTKAKSFIGKCNIIDVQPSWSLAALLGVIPYNVSFNKGVYRFKVVKFSDHWECYHENFGSVSTEIFKADNPVDACYEMIIKLHELKML